LVPRIYDNLSCVVESLAYLSLDFSTGGIYWEKLAWEVDCGCDEETEIDVRVASNHSHYIFVVVIELFVLLASLVKLLTALPSRFLQRPLFNLNCLIKAHNDVDDD
jgi:hypothetical protein